MSEEKVTKKYNTFVKGLITEASAINFPEDASVDEDNFHLHRDGSRERRLGMDYESGYFKTTSSLSTYSGGATSFYSWENADNNPDKNFLVVQAGKHINIFEHTSSGYGASKVEFEIDVDISTILYSVSSANIASHSFSFASANGILYCAQKTVKPFRIEYDTDTDLFSIVEYDLKVRDIWGVPLGAASSITDRPVTLAGTDGWLHKYNLANQGWPNEAIVMSETITAYTLFGKVYEASPSVSRNSNPIDQTVASLGYYPSLSDSFWLAQGLLPTGVSPVNVLVYRPDMLEANPLIEMQMPRGRFIINAFEKNRQDALGTTLAGTESQDKGTPSLIESFAGRIWYAGVESSDVSGASFDDGVKYNSTLFFSQILETHDHAAKCHQENDPTSKDFSEILDTDGGTIELAGAGEIKRLISLHNFLVVLADNGVWTVVGGQDGFTASSYSVRQVSNVGCISADSAVRVEGSIVYWSQAGIYALAVDSQSQDIRTENITQDTIQTHYSDINILAKQYSSGYFDAVQRRVVWSYSDDSSFNGLTNKWRKDREIVFDLVLKAWSPYTISPLASSTPYVMGAVATPNINLNTVTSDVVADGALVVASGVQVTTDSLDYSTQGTSLVYVCGDGSFYAFGGYNNNNLLDWEAEDATGISYISYLITGYENLDETARQKQAVYMTAHFNKTENEFIDDGNGDPILDNQSACSLQARWDWADHSNAGKWGDEQQIYRLKRMYTPTGTLPEPFDNGQPVTTTKNKLRGKGRSSHLRFLSEEGKKMHLLGWQIEYKGKGKV